jgi:acyl-CoA thioester hydrolase
MFTSKTEIRVRYYETDKMGFMHHSNYARYYECARTDAIRTIGYSYADAEKDGTIMPVVKIESKFILPLYYDDVVEVHTEIRTLPRFGIITFYHKFYKDQVLVHEGSVTLAMVNVATNKRENGPQQLMQLMSTYFN